MVVSYTVDEMAREYINISRPTFFINNNRNHIIEHINSILHMLAQNHNISDDNRNILLRSVNILTNDLLIISPAD